MAFSLKNTLTITQQLKSYHYAALRKQREVDLCEFKASLVYRASSKTARVTQRNPVLKNKDLVPLPHSNSNHRLSQNN